MLIDDLQGARVLVVGDVMLDHFVAGCVDRVSPEAPALVLRVDHTRSMLGGAANVAANIASLGGVAVLVGVIGTDVDGAQVAALVSAFDGAIVDAIVRSPTSTTTSKTRYLAGDRHLLRADRENVGIPSEVEEAVAEAVRRHAPDCAAILASDYAKGVVCSAVMRTAVGVANSLGVPLIADPKRRDFALYRGAHLITPNARELAYATGEACDDLASCERASRTVIAVTGASVLLTRSEHGVALFSADASSWSEGAQARSVRDVSGAGDTVLAVSGIALAAGADLAAAAHLANVAAGLAVGKTGTSCVTPDELSLALLHTPDTDALASKLVSMHSAVVLTAAWREQRFTIGFTNGCFDLLHPGHVRLLTEARRLCDRLVVALNTDESIRRLKGSNRPIQTELARAEIIGALRAVDVVLLFDEDTPIDLISALRPDVLIKGSDYTVDTVVGADLVRTWGGRVALVDLVAGESTTKLIAMSKGGGPF